MLLVHGDYEQLYKSRVSRIWWIVL